MDIRADSRRVSRSTVEGPLANGPVGLIGGNFLDIPEPGELQRPGTVQVGFFNLDDDALKVLGVIVGLVR